MRNITIPLYYIFLIFQIKPAQARYHLPIDKNNVKKPLCTKCPSLFSGNTQVPTDNKICPVYTHAIIRNKK
jgi:hypothetical protein